MALLNPLGLAVQNAWYTSVFSLVYLLLTLVTGVWMGIAVSFVVATAAAVAYRVLGNKMSV